MIRRIFLDSLTNVRMIYTNYKPFNYFEFQRKNIFHFSIKNKIPDIKEEQSDRYSNKFIKRQRKNNKQKTLQSMLIQYKRDNQKQNLTLQKLLQACKTITQIYTKQNHYEFVRQSKILQNLLQHLGRQQLNSNSLQDYLTMINFFSVLKLIQNINRSVLDIFKDIVTIKLQPYIKKYNTLLLQDKIRVYCGLSELNYTDLQLLSEPLLSQYKQVLNNEIDIDEEYIQLLLESMSRKKTYFQEQKQLVQISLTFIDIYFEQYQKINILRFCSLLNSDNLTILTQSKSSSKLYTSIFSKMMKSMKEGFDVKQLQYVLSSQCSSGNFMDQLFQYIYQMLIQKIMSGDYHQMILQYLSKTTFKLRGKKYSEKHIMNIIKCIQRIVKNKQETELIQNKKNIQLVCLQLINNHFFDSKFQIFNKIINFPQFQVYWSFPYEYSRRNIAFPIDRLLQKIKPNSFTLKRDSNFLKMSVSISIQSKIQNNNKLHQYQALLKKNINSQKFNLQDAEWLNKQSRSNYNLVKTFHKQYCLQFEQSILQSQSKHLFSNSWKQSFTYWVYLFTVSEQINNSNVSLSKASLKIIKMIIKRQLQNFNPIVNINKNILSTIINNIKLGKFNFDKNLFKQINDILQLYVRQLPNSQKDQIQLYLDLVNIYIEKYQEGYKDEIFCYLLSKIISLKHQKIIKNQKFTIILTTISKLIIPHHHNHQCINIITKYHSLSTDNQT